MVIVGGGFGGLLAAARLHKSGVKDIRIIEKGGDFGGTWCSKSISGWATDIESYIYLPLLEETGYIPKEKYSFGDEIRAHARRIGEKFDLYRLACFQTEISEIRWLQDESRWLISTNRGDAMRARFVVMANGPLHRPKLPGIPGVERFKGHSFHTSRWDYGYTGGDLNGGLSRLRDKRVGIIGTGATPCSACRTWPRRPSSSTSSSGRPRRSTCAATGRPIRNGRQPGARLAAAADGQLQRPGLRRLPRARTWSTTAGPTSSATSLLRAAAGPEPSGARGAGPDVRNRRLQEDGADPCPGRCDRRGPTTAEALKP